jgi:hypothetical protein
LQVLVGGTNNGGVAVQKPPQCPVSFGGRVGVVAGVVREQVVDPPSSDFESSRVNSSVASSPPLGRVPVRERSLFRSIWTTVDAAPAA